MDQNKRFEAWSIPGGSGAAAADWRTLPDGHWLYVPWRVGATASLGLLTLLYVSPYLELFFRAR